MPILASPHPLTIGVHVSCTVCDAEQAKGLTVDSSMGKQAWADRLGVSRPAVQRHLKHGLKEQRAAQTPGTTEASSDGSRSVTAIRDRPVTLDDARDWIRASGDDPDSYTLSIRAIAYGLDMFSNRMSATPKRGQAAGSLIPNTDDLYRSIDAWTPPARTVDILTDATFVVCAADLQTGKTDFGLKSADLTDRVLRSFAAAADIARERQFAEIVIADLGDIVENINSTSSQRATNDLAITEQIRLARRLMLEGIKMLAPLTPKLTYAAVPSNHGSVRIGPKSPENHVLDDYGIEIAYQLHDICAESEKLFNVEFKMPIESLESLSFDTSGTNLGMAHGHQAQGADGLGKWWQGQSHGRMPMANADIALFGHFHSLRLQQSGDARWLMVGPASDNGSSWFTNKTGERSQAGMLSFVTANGAWSDLRIL